MAVPFASRIYRWILNSLLWDTGAHPSQWTEYLWAARKSILIIAVTVFLTWREWVEHHPPEIVIVALLHFIFVFAVVALVILAAQRLGRRINKVQN